MNVTEDIATSSQEMYPSSIMTIIMETQTDFTGIKEEYLNQYISIINLKNLFEYFSFVSVNDSMGYAIRCRYMPDLPITEEYWNHVKKYKKNGQPLFVRTSLIRSSFRNEMDNDECNYCPIYKIENCQNFVVKRKEEIHTPRVVSEVEKMFGEIQELTKVHDERKRLEIKYLSLANEVLQTMWNMVSETREQYGLRMAATPYHIYNANSVLCTADSIIFSAYQISLDGLLTHMKEAVFIQ